MFWRFWLRHFYPINFKFLSMAKWVCWCDCVNVCVLVLIESIMVTVFLSLQGHSWGCKVYVDEI